LDSGPRIGQLSAGWRLSGHSLVWMTAVRTRGAGFLPVRKRERALRPRRSPDLPARCA
jgi:hypothetical protein